MKITRRIVAKRLADYLHHQLTLAGLVSWAEDALQEGVFEEKHAEMLGGVVGRLGLADADGFALSWADCEQLLRDLGYSARIAIVAA